MMATNTEVIKLQSKVEEQASQIQRLSNLIHKKIEHEHLSDNSNTFVSVVIFSVQMLQILCC